MKAYGVAIYRIAHTKPIKITKWQCDQIQGLWI
nr:MAG TPA: hypothetical protein [Bacteriophage sp.]